MVLVSEQMFQKVVLRFGKNWLNVLLLACSWINIEEV